MSKIYPWHGCNNVFARCNGGWDDPDILYDVYCFNYWDIENTLWESFVENNHLDIEAPITDETEEAFSQYVREEAESYLIDCIDGDYFASGERSWSTYNQLFDSTSHAPLSMKQWLKLTDTRMESSHA